MNKTIISLPLFLALSTGARGQSGLEYDLKKYATSSQTVVDERRWHNNDLENSRLYVARSMVSLVDYMMGRADSSAFDGLHRPEHNVLAASFDNVNAAGRFIHYDGKRQTFGRLLAGGELHTERSGTLFGMAAYQRGEMTRTSLNYATHPEDYAPYFVADTLGQSAVNREIYTVYGGYSLALGGWQWGLEARYEGIAQARRQNPRHSNYTHSVGVGLGMSRVWQRNIVALTLRPEWSRQSIAAKSLLDGVRFMDFYGFGLWNRRESQGAVSYGRQQTLHGIGADMAWMHDGLWAWTLAAGWKYRSMNSEEANFKELFGSHTHHFHQQLIVERRFDKCFWLFQFSAKEYARSGSEHIYEQQVQHADEGLFDYVKVGTNQLYHSSGVSMDLRSKVISPVRLQSSVAMMAAVGWKRDEERYDSPQMKVANQTLTMSLGVEYKWQRGHFAWETGLNAGMQSGWNNSYNVTATTDAVQEAMAYTPYLLRGESRQTLEGRLVGLRKLSDKLAVGGFVKGGYLNSDYREMVNIRTGLFLRF